MEKINVEITKIGLNPDSKLAVLQNDFSVTDSHPNIRKGDVRIGIVYSDYLIPEVGLSYAVYYKDSLKSFTTTDVVKVVDLFTFYTKNSVYYIRVLDRLIDYSYDIDFVEILNFEFDKKNEIVDLSNYKILETEIDRVLKILQYEPESRKAVIVLANNTTQPSCLISLQYLINDNTLICIANYRSQHMKYGYLHDIKMLRYLTTYLTNRLPKFDNVKIKVHVADFHNYEIKDGNSNNN